MSRIGKVQVEEFIPILKAEEIHFYRNKVEFAFSCKRWLTRAEIDSGIPNQQDVLGFHPSGAYDKIIDINHCYLQGDPSNALRLNLKNIGIEQGLSFFDIRANTGFLRQTMLRITTLGQIMLVVGFYEDHPEKRKTYLDEVLKRHPEITSLMYCINPKVNDFLNDLEMIVYKGNDYIEEKLGDIVFRIGPKSFFQTNTKQAIRLYDVVADFAGLTGQENVYDLYTGIGSIALYLAKNCKQVVGIEEIPAAIQDAKENAVRNNVNNCVFYAGDVKNILTTAFAEKHGKADVIITDPPRAGMHPQVVEMFLQLEAPKIVYVSCNPATQARDLNALSEKYDIKKLRPVDMFPLTHHIESVALLELK